jgi:hypothetical protein
MPTCLCAEEYVSSYNRNGSSPFGIQSPLFQTSVLPAPEARYLSDNFY